MKVIEINNFYIDDSVKFMKRNILDNYIDLIITSPPYDDLRKYNGFIFDYQSMLKELYRVTKEGGVVVWVAGDATINGSETGTSFKHALYAKEVGFNLHDTMIYHKNNPPPTGGNNRYYQSFEYMFVLSKGKPKTFNPIIVNRRNKWNDKRTERYRAVTRNKDGNFAKKIIPIKEMVKKQNTWTYVVSGGSSTKDKIAHDHPAIFPEQLVLDHILSWSNEGDIVLDPMCGSGTVAKMAWLNKRNFIGIDISEEYINNICKPRLSTYGWKTDENLN